MPRIRSRFIDFLNLHYKDGAIDGDASGRGVVEQISESSYPGSCNVDHFKCPLLSAMVPTRVKGEHFLFNSIPIGPSNEDLLFKQVELAVSRLNWGKLPSSSEFGIIQILAEMDEMISMFALRFWKSLSYGSFTWGVMPFVSDLIAVADAVQNLSKNLSQFRYEDELIVDVGVGKPVSIPNFYFVSSTGHCVVRKTGVADISFQHPGSIALDWLGFHPDLATAWDLIPFSFVIDYLLPIGDYLESFRSGGWVKTAYFRGWLTLRFKLDLIWHGFVPDYMEFTTDVGRYERFVRSYSPMALVVPTTPGSLDLQVPSFRQLFNMLYLAIQQGKRHR